MVQFCLKWAILLCFSDSDSSCHLLRAAHSFLVNPFLGKPNILPIRNRIDFAKVHFGSPSSMVRWAWNESSGQSATEQWLNLGHFRIIFKPVDSFIFLLPFYFDIGRVRIIILLLLPSFEYSKEPTDILYHLACIIETNVLTCSFRPKPGGFSNKFLRACVFRKRHNNKRPSECQPGWVLRGSWNTLEVLCLPIGPDWRSVNLSERYYVKRTDFRTDVPTDIRKNIVGGTRSGLNVTPSRQLFNVINRYNLNQVRRYRNFAKSPARCY